jgi:hypothetical protein
MWGKNPAVDGHGCSSASRRLLWCLHRLVDEKR